MKRFASYTLYALLLVAATCACDDDIRVRQSYAYGIETLPLPKTLQKGESVALEFSIVREGRYSGTRYKFRYFQPDGAGKLTGRYDEEIPVNRFQNITSDSFTPFTTKVNAKISNSLLLCLKTISDNG